MEYNKKLKMRLFFGIGYIVIGVALILSFLLIDTENDYFSSFGFALIVIGAVRVRNHFLITKNEETLKKQEIAETDERNIAIANRAKSIAFMVYIIASAISVIALQILHKSELATVISATMCFMLLVYWVSYFIISKKS